MPEVGAVLAELRNRAGYTQEQLAERLGVGRAYLSRVETNHRKPSWKMLLRFAEVLRIPIGQLLRDVGLIGPSAAEMQGIEQDIAESIAVRPDLADLLQIVRENPDIAGEVLPYARYLAIRAKSEQEGGSTAPKRKWREEPQES